MILLLDIGNTHTHLGLATQRRVVRRANIPTSSWAGSAGLEQAAEFAAAVSVETIAVCSVVPRATRAAKKALLGKWSARWFELGPATAGGVIERRYPKPETMGPDRLANVIAAHRRCGGPCIAIDFGTAVTFDVVNRRGEFIGGVIAPGIAMMTGYLHEKTALLPEIQLRESRCVIGRGTEEAMLAAAVYGFRGMVRSLIQDLRREVRSPAAPVIATGGYARFVARRVPEISLVDVNLTLEGLRLSCGER